MPYGAVDDTEANALLPHTEVVIIKKPKYGSGPVALLSFIAVAVSVSSIGYAGYRSIFSYSDQTEKHFTASESIEVEVVPAALTLTITASNEYGQFIGPYPWLETTPGSQLVEPFKQTILSIGGSVTLLPDLHYNWTLSEEFQSWGTPKPDLAEYNLIINDIGQYQVSVTAMDSNNTIVAEFSTLLICKFVKREIRTLTIDDREKFLNAAFALWNHTQEEGEIKYGRKFTSIGTSTLKSRYNDVRFCYSAI